MNRKLHLNHQMIIFVLSTFGWLLACITSGSTSAGPFEVQELNDFEGQLTDTEVRALASEIPWETDIDNFRRRLQSAVMPPIRMIITNADHIADTWVVHEAELFFGYCHENVRVPQAPTLVVDSGSSNLFPRSIGRNAFDYDLNTNWTANCKYILSGCKPFSQWVGLSIMGTARWRGAYVVNASAKALDAVKVKCLRLYQNPHQRFRPGAVAIQEVRVGLTGFERFTLEILNFTAGGGWIRRPAYDDTLTRLTNLARTQAAWAVSELEFFGDIFCNYKLYGATFSSGCSNALVHGDERTFDDNERTKWVSSCAGPCAPFMAYVGIDFSDTVTFVRCIRFVQSTHDPHAPIPELPSNSSGLALERWDGRRWRIQERFWPSWAQYPLSLAPTLLTPYLMGVAGNWDITLPPDRGAWRLLNDDWTEATWHVHEVEFHMNANCTGRHTGEGIEIGGPAYATNAALAFDGVSDFAAGWLSHCSKPFGACDPMETWLGQYFQNAQRDVQCFRLLQSHFQLHQAGSVQLSKWQDRDWVLIEIHRQVGGGCWNSRPAPPWTMWRVLNVAPVQAQWRVLEIRAYRDTECLTEVTHGEPISSGFLLWRQNMINAFDASAVTAWGADCRNCSQTHKYWVGAQMPMNSEDASDGKGFLRCMKIWQSPYFHEQVSRVRVDVWSGVDWTPATLTEGGLGLVAGGGSWVRTPAAFASRWRIVAAKPDPGIWRVHDIQFFGDSNCTEPLRLPGQGGTDVTVSGFRPLPGFSAVKLISEASLGADGDSVTSFLLDHKPNESRPAWIGIDFLSESIWVRCIHIWQGSLLQEQTTQVQLEFWDGTGWAAGDVELLHHETHLVGMGGGGWHRRPAGMKTQWILENAEYVPEGWSLLEAEFHDDIACRDPDPQATAAVNGTFRGLGGKAIASGYVPPMRQKGPQNAFDGDIATTWMSQCSKVAIGVLPRDVNMPALGCRPGEAWIGLDFGTRVHEVRCLRLYQVGYREMQSLSVNLSYWDGTHWEAVWTLNGLGGSAWDQRPAAANTMWRVVNKQPRNINKRCRGQASRNLRRPWGIAELEFYLDDDCTRPARPGVAISSGAVENFRIASSDLANYSTAGAADGDIETVWAANCHLGFSEPNRSRVSCENEWVGIDFHGSAVEVRCMRVMQSRMESPTCCDVSHELELQRWNGTTWLEAGWRHEPPSTSGYVPRDLGAHFQSMGMCPLISDNKPYAQARIWEKRARRDSKSCAVPLTGAVVLMGDRQCIQHLRCEAVFGGAGSCCPEDDVEGFSTRCCCNFLEMEAIFHDESVDGTFRRDLNFENAVITLSRYLIYPGGPAAFLLLLMAVCLPSEARAICWDWAEDDGARCRCVRVMLATLIAPALTWHSYLEEGEDYISGFCRWFCMPQRRRLRFLELPRAILWIAMGAVIGSFSPWLALGVLFGQLFLKFLLALALLIRWSKSPYDPHIAGEMALRHAATGDAIKELGDPPNSNDVLRDLVSTIIIGFVYFLKFVFDLLVIRATMISYNAIPPISAERVVDIFPGLIGILRNPGIIIYRAMNLAGQILTRIISFFIGIPQCQGSTTVVGATALIMVLVAVCQWLNFDFFGLYTAARQVVKTTRPECQRSFAQGAVLFCFSITFGAIQCAMVLFSRAVSIANPFKFSTWACQWDDFWAYIIGQALIAITSVIGIVLFFLCVNGHFMGQDYILKPLGDFLHMDLSELDPDGVGESGGVFRWDVFLSSFPTLFGVWIDRWNVRGYLVEERSRIYAEKLGDPQPCMYCGKTHVKYVNIMVATGRQVSLAFQLMPYGMLIGKAAEYLNDPPLIYIGTRLGCISPVQTQAEKTAPLLSKGTLGTKLLVLVAKLCALCADWGLPLLRRFLTLALYGLVLVGVFAFNEENLVELGRPVIVAAVVLALMKSASESLLETLLNLIIGSIISTMSQEVRIGKSSDMTRTVAGQLASGCCVSAAIGVLLSLSGRKPSISLGPLKTIEAGLQGILIALLGSAVGFAISVLGMLLSFMVEVPANAPPSRRRSAMATGLKLGYSSTIGLFAFFFADLVLTLRGRIGLFLAVAGIQALALKILMVDRPSPEDSNDIRLQEEPWRASPVLPVLRSRQLPSIVGTFLAGVIATRFGDAGGSSEANIAAATFGLVVAMLVGVVCGMAVNRMLDKYPQLIGFFFGVVVMLSIIWWNEFASVVAGAFVGSFVGSIFEHYQIQDILRRERQHCEEENRLQQERLEKERLAKLRAPKDRDHLLTLALTEAWASPQVKHAALPGPEEAIAKLIEDASHVKALDLKVNSQEDLPSLMQPCSIHSGDEGPREAGLAEALPVLTDAAVGDTRVLNYGVISAAAQGQDFGVSPMECTNSSAWAEAAALAKAPPPLTPPSTTPSQELTGVEGLPPQTPNARVGTVSANISQPPSPIFPAGSSGFFPDDTLRDESMFGRWDRPASSSQQQRTPQAINGIRTTQVHGRPTVWSASLETPLPPAPPRQPQRVDLWKVPSAPKRATLKP